VIASIINDRFDMQDSKFLSFWYNNRMIKTKEKDKIKCWTQLGKVNVFKIMTENDTISFKKSIQLKKTVAQEGEERNCDFCEKVPDENTNKS